MYYQNDNITTAKKLFGKYVLVAIVFVAALLLTIFGIVRGTITDSEPYKHSVELLNGRPEIISQIGYDYKQTGLILGRISNKITSGSNGMTSSGSADFTYKIKGQDGISKVEVTARKIDGVWIYDSVQFYAADGNRIINLLKK